MGQIVFRPSKWCDPSEDYQYGNEHYHPKEPDVKHEIQLESTTSAVNAAAGSVSMAGAAVMATDADEPGTQVVEYSPIATALANLRNRFTNVVFDVATTKGLDEARLARADIREYRYSLEKERVRVKAPVLARIGMLDGEAKRLTTELLALENPIDLQIKKREAEIEARRVAKESAERAHLKQIQQRLDWIKGLPGCAIGYSADAIKDAISTLRELPVTPELYGELLVDAAEARALAVVKLTGMFEAATANEVEAARLKTERAALEAEKAARKAADDLEATAKAESERVEREQKAEEARVAKEAADAVAAREKAVADAEKKQADEAKALAKKNAEVAAEQERQRLVNEQAERERSERALAHDALVAEARKRYKDPLEAIGGIAAVCRNPTFSDIEAREMVLIIATVFV